ncbi:MULTISPECIES: Rrf2 family transcriptional regulator [unclassified Adlercreutzia]|uniref:RrF2 family transcriptional regulator n=1 Tax=unclassified Adlercreutzia TaxID=2636013 RepID=UPI0013EBA689|nr:MULTISPECIES: Rrf2 family transcriptional regulator [unclassified Adlercreutzia]
MDITRRCDYACRMLRAVCTGQGRISVAEIAESEDIPYAFARSIQHDLVKAGFLRTVRGARGGVSMARPLEEVTVLDVLRAVEGTVAISPCSEDPAYCPRSSSCAYHRVWCGADRLLESYFSGITLADLFGDAVAAGLAEGEDAPEADEAGEEAAKANAARSSDVPEAAEAPAHA